LLGISFTYDVLGRLTRLDHPDGAFRSYDFGLGGIVVTETDERSNQTEYRYRSYGHPDSGKVPINIFSPENVCTFIDYNLLNQVTRVFQGEWNAVDLLCGGFDRDFGYDTRFFLETEDNPETGITTFGRDAIGNMISRQVGTSDVTIFDYDNRNRLKFTNYPGTTPDVTRVYDENDNIKEVNNADSFHKYDYDENDNLKKEIIDIGVNQYIVDYTYDSNDIIKTLTYPSGRLIDYSADAFGRPRQVTPYVTSINYYPSGQLQQIVYANGQTTDVTLTDRLWVERIHAHGGTEAIDLTYGYDDIGNVETITDAIDPLSTRSLGYDGINRLATADGSWGTGTFTYDHQGNIETMDIGSSAKDYSYFNRRLDRVTSLSAGTLNLYAYDVYGNIEYDTLTDLSVTNVFSENRYIYDDAGNLRTALRTQGGGVPAHTFGYDGNGMRVSKTTSSVNLEFVYAKNGNLLGEYDPNVGTLFGKENIYLGSQLVANAQENQLPTADAGPGDTVFGTQQVTLDGSGSSDPDGDIVSYNWQQTAGTPVVLADPTSATTTFTAPIVAAEETLTFQLTVTDDVGETASDTVDIQVLDNSPPTANAGPDQLVIGGDLVTLDGTASSDNESSITWQWTQTAGIGVGLSGATTATPSFTAPVTGANHSLTFELTVTDVAGVTDSDQVDIDVLDPDLNVDDDGLPDAWEIINFGDITSYTGSDDPDGDGISNQQEFEEGTDPNTAAPAPDQLSGVVAIAGEGENVIDWNNAVSVSAYNIYWSTTPGVTQATGTKIADVTSPYTHTGLINGTTYYYVVTAENGSGESPDSSEVSATPNLRAWGDPTIVAATSEEINVATNSRGDIVAARITFDGSQRRVWTRRFTSNLGWENPVLITTGLANLGLENIRTALDEAGNALVVWMQSDATRMNIWSSYFDVATGSWGTPILVETYNGSGSENGDVEGISRLVMAPDGNAVLAWDQEKVIFFPDGQSLVGNLAYASFYTPGSGWSSRVDIDSNSGQVVAVWDRVSIADSASIFLPKHRNIWASTFTPGGGWSTATIIDDNPALEHEARDPDVAIDGAGNAVTGPTITISLPAPGRSPKTWLPLEVFLPHSWR
jgi:YD repeat-containing protein